MTECRGSDATICYLSKSAAEKDLREGENLVTINGAQEFFGKITGVLIWLLFRIFAGA